MLDDRASLRLDALRFPLVVCVVFIHAYETRVGVAGGSVGVTDNGFLVEFTRNVVSQGIARAAVPLFFLMSGFLFFAGLRLSRRLYLAKLRSRVHTLLVPFLFWNLLTIALVYLAQSWPPTQAYFSGRQAEIGSMGLGDFLSAVFGIGRMPISYQFWFIRDLIVLALLAPVFHLAITRLGVGFIGALFLCWGFGVWPLYMPSAEAMLFFAIGCHVAIQGQNLFAADRYARWIGVAYAGVLVADALLLPTGGNAYLHRIGIVLGVLTFLSLTGVVVRSARWRKAMLSLGATSFFIFAAHEPLLTIARKVSYKLIEPQAVPTILGLYVAIPLLVIGVLVLSNRVLWAWVPGLTRLMGSAAPRAVERRPVADAAQASAL